MPRQVVIRFLTVAALFGGMAYGQPTLKVRLKPNLTESTIEIPLERYVAAVSGISKQRPIVEALLDSEGTVLDENRNPLSLEEARASVNRVQQKYQERVKAAPKS